MALNDKIQERRKDYKPNLTGDKSVNVKTDRKDAADVPATRQKDIASVKNEEKENKEK